MLSLERIVEVLETSVNPLCDDCLSEKAGVKPRQQTNIICRSLEGKGKLKRNKARCSSCQKNKILNIIVQKNNTPQTVRETSAVDGEKYEPGEILDSIRRELIRFFNMIDDCAPTTKGKETFSERLSRLIACGKIPDKIGIVIRFLNAIRNHVVYNQCEIAASDKPLIDIAWKIVNTWMLNSIT